MKYENVDDVLMEYEGRTPDIGDYYGFVVNDLHIHCKSFTYCDSYLDLLNEKEHVIVRIYDRSEITKITICNSNYWDEVGALYIKDERKKVQI